MFNRETDSQHEIVLGEQTLKLPYDEKLTRATLILAAMQRHDVRAFEAALVFPFISESMTYKRRYDILYAYCRWGLDKKPYVEDDDYASGSEWLRFFEWRRDRRESWLGHSQPIPIRKPIAGDRDTIGTWVG